MFDPASLPSELRTWDVRPSFLDSLPLVRRYSRALLPLMPMAFGRFDVSDYDVVVTVSSAFSKNVTAPPGGGTRNLCYCLTPPRYLWDLRDAYIRTGLKLATAPIVQWLQTADRAAAARVDEFIAISHAVADRVRRSYERSADVIYPPVETERIRPMHEPPEKFYLVVSRLVRYKRIDLAIEACNRLGRDLVVVGVGPERRRLGAIAGPTIRFLGAQSDPEITELYGTCRAFLFPGHEDFGITPVEAQAAGRPVVAFGAGGAAETVLDGTTGVLFAEQTVDSLVGAIERLERSSIEGEACRSNAERFDASVFRARMAAAVTAAGERRGVARELT